MAARVRVTYTPSMRGTREIAEMIDRATARAAGSARDEMKRIIRDEGRVDTGALVQSVESERVENSVGRITYEVGSRLDYAILQNDGVKGPVLPRNARVLRFTPKGKTTAVFARSTKGFAGIHFLERALQRLDPDDWQQGAAG